MEKKTLIVGAAKECITPPAELFPIEHFWMRDTGKNSIFSGKIRQDVFFRIVLIGNGNNTTAIAVLDLPGVPRCEEYMEIIGKTAEIPIENVLLTCSHNHSCIYVDNPHFDKVFGHEYSAKADIYRDYIAKAIERATAAAKQSMQPAKMGWLKDKCYLNVNRREAIAGENATYGFDPGGSADRDLTLIRFDDLNGKCIALLYNFAVHACMMIHNDPEGLGTEISGDMPGYASRLIENSMNDEAVVIFTSGAAGDMNPLIMSRANIVREDGKLHVEQLGAAGPILLEFMGRRFARYIEDANAKLVCDIDSAKIWCKKDHASFPAPFEKMPPRDVCTGLIMIGDVAVAFSNGEWVHRIGMRLKEDSPYRKTMYVTHAGPHIGYIMDDSGNGIEEIALRKMIYSMMNEYTCG